MARVTVRESVTVAGRAERARVARTFVGAVPGPGRPCGDDAALPVSELFGNSIRHTSNTRSPWSLVPWDAIGRTDQPAITAHDQPGRPVSAVIRTEELTKLYPGTDFAAVDRLSLDDRADETFGLPGPRGVGKPNTGYWQFFPLRCLRLPTVHALTGRRRAPSSNRGRHTPPPSAEPLMPPLPPRPPG
jgi:hypothetical protein